jgi:uncharacterized protein
MQARITVITLGVDDLDAAVRFYRDGLGFPTEGIVGQELEHGAVAFFDLQPGLRHRASVASAGLRNRRGHLPLELADWTSLLVRLRFRRRSARQGSVTLSRMR